MPDNPNYDVTEVVEVRAQEEVNELLALGWRLLAVQSEGPLYVLGRPRLMRPAPRPEWLDTPRAERDGERLLRFLPDSPWAEQKS